MMTPMLNRANQEMDSQARTNPSQSRQQKKKLHVFTSNVLPKLNKAVSFEMKGDMTKAVELFEQCAKSGCTTSMDALGRIYMHGQGVPVDSSRGAKWLQQCVRHGPSIVALGGWDSALMSATGLLGQAYRHGWGVAQDRSRAADYLEQAAQGGERFQIVSDNVQAGKQSATESC